MIVSYKYIRTFCASRIYWIIVVFPQRTLKEKYPIFLVNTLLLHIPLLTLTRGWMEWRTKKRIHLLCVGWRNFFSSCAVVSVFWFLAGNRFWFYIFTYLEYNTVVVLRQNNRQRNKYTCCAWAGGTKSQFVVEGKFIRDSYNTCLKFNIRVKILWVIYVLICIMFSSFVKRALLNKLFYGLLSFL